MPIDFEITGAPAEATGLSIELPPLGDVLSLWMAPHLRPPHASILNTAEVRRFTRRPDGQTISPELARAIADSPSSLAIYRGARRAALERATEGGVVYAECPGCRTWRADILPLALAVGLHVAFHPVVDATGVLAVPALGRDGTRVLPGLPIASRLTFALPGTGAGQGEFASDPAAHFAAWKARGDALFRDSANATEDWEPTSPGWRALLRFGALLGGWPRPDVLSGPEALATIPLGEFLWIDNVYYLTHLVPQPAGTPLVVTCPGCQTTFQPLAAAAEWPDRNSEEPAPGPVQ